MALHNVLHSGFICLGNFISALGNVFAVGQSIVMHCGNECPFEGLA